MKRAGLLLVLLVASANACSAPPQPTEASSALYTADDAAQSAAPDAGELPLVNAPGPRPGVQANPTGCYVAAATPEFVSAPPMKLPDYVCSPEEIALVAGAASVTETDYVVDYPAGVAEPCALCIDATFAADPTHGPLDEYACLALVISQRCANDVRTQQACFAAHCQTCAAEEYERCVDESIEQGTCVRLHPQCRGLYESEGANRCFDRAPTTEDFQQQLAFVAKVMCGY